MFLCSNVSRSIGERAPSHAYSALLVAAQRRAVTDLGVRCEKVVRQSSHKTTSLITSITNVHILRALRSGSWNFDGQARIPVAGFSIGRGGRTYSCDPELGSDERSASLEWTRMGNAAPDRADTPAPLGWKRQCGRSCWTLCTAVVVETAETMMTRVPKKQLRRGLEDSIFPQGKAARRENPDADALWCMCQCCSTILWLEKPKMHQGKSSRVIATVTGGRSRVGEKV